MEHLMWPLLVVPAGTWCFRETVACPRHSYGGRIRKSVARQIRYAGAVFLRNKRLGGVYEEQARVF